MKTDADDFSSMTESISLNKNPEYSGCHWCFQTKINGTASNHVLSSYEILFGTINA